MKTSKEEPFYPIQSIMYSAPFGRFKLKRTLQLLVDKNLSIEQKFTLKVLRKYGIFAKATKPFTDYRARILVSLDGKTFIVLPYIPEHASFNLTGIEKTLFFLRQCINLLCCMFPYLRD